MKIGAIAIINIIGRPADYLEEIMEKVVEQLKKDKGIVIKKIKIEKPTIIKQKTEEIKKAVGEKEVFGAFCELEMEFKDFSKLLGFMIDYMPASIEIVEPSEIKMSLNEMNGFLADFMGKLHLYDEVTKKLKLERDTLVNQFNSLITKINQAKKKQKEKEKNKKD